MFFSLLSQKQTVVMFKVSTSQWLINPASYSQWETYRLSLLNSCKLGRLICQYHYIYLNRTGLMTLVGLVLLAIVSFSGLLCSPCLSHISFSGRSRSVPHSALFFLFAENMLSVLFLWSAPFFPPTYSIEGNMVMSYTVYTLFFPTIN